MDTFIISLPFSPRRAIVKRLIEFGYNPIFIDALDARNKSEQDIKQFDYESFYNKNNFYPSKGEVGCAVSHFNLYVRLANTKTQQDYFLITEDDCIPKAFSEEMLSIINSVKDLSPDIVLLGYAKVDESIYSEIQRSNPIRVLKKALHGKYQIGENMLRQLVCAVSYLVSRNF